jgi:capsular polysaccharide biosynthesis protein
MKLWEMRYGEEPVNGRLFLLRFIRKIHIVIISALIGAVLVCGIHLLYRLSGEKMYIAETDMHLEYIPEAGSNQLIYYNEHTWQQMSKDSAIIDEIIKADSSLDPAVVREAFVATLKSDVKVLTLQVTCNDPGMCMKITDAAVAGITAYTESLPEIISVSVIGKASEAVPVAADVRAIRALILGAIVGLFISCLYVAVVILSDDRILLPEVIEKRYMLPAAGTLTSANIEETLSDLAGDEGFIIASTLADTDVTKVIDTLKKSGAKPEAKALDLSDTDKKGLAEEVKSADRPIVYVFSSHKSPRADERALSFLSKYEKEPMCAILADSDDALIRAYYIGKKSRFKDL